MPSAKHIVTRIERDGWISPSALATLLGLTPPTVNKYVRDHKITGVKVGGVTRIWAIEIQRILDVTEFVYKADPYVIQKVRNACILRNRDIIRGEYHR